eukprot:29445-Rhodomonas_salina.1
MIRKISPRALPCCKLTRRCNAASDCNPHSRTREHSCTILSVTLALCSQTSTSLDSHRAHRTLRRQQQRAIVWSMIAKERRSVITERGARRGRRWSPARAPPCPWPRPGPPDRNRSNRQRESAICGWNVDPDCGLNVDPDRGRGARAFRGRGIRRATPRLLQQAVTIGKLCLIRSTRVR